MADRPRTGDFVDPSKTITSQQDSMINGMSRLGTAASLITGVGTVADIALNVMDNREAEKMKEQQERNVKEQDKQATAKRKKNNRRRKSPVSSYGVVQEMFNQSIGHTSYGASRLPGQR